MAAPETTVAVDATFVVAVVAALGWVLTIAVAVLKGRELVARAALDAVGSIEGRNVVLTITNEKHSRVEEKLDALASSVNGMAARIETQMREMSTELKAQLARLDADARDLDVRLAVIEDKRGARREEK